MCSIFCIIFAAILLFIGLLVFAGLLLWCDTFQIAQRGRTLPTAPVADDAEAGAAAKAKAAEEDTTARAKADAEAKAKAEEEADDADKTDADGDGLPDIETATSEQAAEAFREDLDSGVVRQEEQLGILYNQSPDDIDDLKLIKGVAKVLEGRLHDSDVFRFKQIALWTDTAAREFGTKLSFRDRIFRDDWIAQAKQFHEDKYGEKL